MRLIKCKNNHSFDKDKFYKCPYCASQNVADTIMDIYGTKQGQIQTIRSKNDITEDTVSLHLLRGKTVGWLVSLSGITKGESYCLHQGENHIGRAENMDVCLYSEQSISREKHATISYSDITKTYSIHSEKNYNNILCNGKPMTKHKRKIKHQDILTFGNINFLFVALCNKNFDWEDYKDV